MAESEIIRRELDEFVTRRLAAGVSAALMGLELMTLGMGMVIKIVGEREMAEHFRRMAEEFDRNAERCDDGYSAIG